MKQKKIKAPNSRWDFFAQRTALSDIRQSKTKKILATISAILCALIVALVIACSVCGTWNNIGEVINTIFTSGFKDVKMRDTLFSNMSILIVAGLAFIFAYKAGLFNIGISGQMVMGGTLGTLVCHLCPAPANGANQVVLLLVCMIGGAAIATIVGALKAFLNVNEVVSSIMFNWIIYYMSVLILSKAGLPTDSSGMNTDAPANELILKASVNGSFVTWLPLIIIAGLLVVIVAVVLNYTVFGKKLKVTGLSRTGALAAGYSVKRNTILAMAISGAIAGILGAMVYTGYSPQMPVTASAKAIPQEGFNGISVGLIAMCSPLASIPVSLFFSMVQTSVSSLQAVGIDNHIAQVVFGIVVYGAAMIALFLNIKPYWLTIGIFKGKNYSKIKKERNLTNLALLEIANDYNEQLRKYYFYNIKAAKIKDSLRFTPLMRIKMLIGSLRYRFVWSIAAIKVKANKRRCVYSRKYYFLQDMTHICKKKGKLYIDAQYKKKFGGVWINITAKALADPNLLILIENATKIKPDEQFMKQLQDRWNRLKDYHFDSRNLALVPKLSYLLNLRSGLAFRYDIANQNELDRLTLVATDNWARDMGLPAIRNKEQYELARSAFLRAWDRVAKEIKQHYDKCTEELGYSKKADKSEVYDITKIKYDPMLIEDHYVKYLRQEIKNTSDDIYKPMILKGNIYNKRATELSKEEE